MKKIIYSSFLLFCSGTLMLTSCLDEDPLYTQNNKIIFKSEQNAEQALLGCYGYLTNTSAYGQQWQEFPISISGLAWTQRTGSDEDNNVSLNITINSAQASIAWTGMYKVIAEVNSFLDNIKKSDLNPQVKEQKRAEACFLRGLAYYNLATLYGGVPLKETASSSEGINTPRAKVADVYNFVINDFKEALRLTRAHEDGRADSLAAKAYLGKVYHKMACLGIEPKENLQKAKQMFDEVYNKYALEPKFGNLFVDFVNKSKESIFQLNFNSESTVCYNRSTNRFAPAKSTSGIAWGTYKATKLAYDLMHGAYPKDPRIAETFLTSWRFRRANNQATPPPPFGDNLSVNDTVYAYPYIVYTKPNDFVVKNGKPTKERKKYLTAIPYEDLTTPSNPSVEELKKYVEKAQESGVTKEDSFKLAAIGNCVKNNFAADNYQDASPYFKKMYDPNAVGTRNHRNLILYRYAEMLLLMADVYNELGDTPKAIQLANEVLTRARNSVKGATQPANWSASLTQEEVREKLYFERIFEFLGEPNMFEMTRLKGKAYFQKLLQLHNNHHITKASAEQYAVSKNRWLDRLYDGGDLSENFILKNYLAPIPQNEINNNESIKDIDNNPGY